MTDTPFSWDYDGRHWTPANYEDRYLGRVTVRRALEMSLNAATARVAFQIGLPRVLNAAERLGMPGPLPARGTFTSHRRSHGATVTPEEKKCFAPAP